LSRARGGFCCDAAAHGSIELRVHGWDLRMGRERELIMTCPSSIVLAVRTWCFAASHPRPKSSKNT
jgi:hypothetical protein